MENALKRFQSITGIFPERIIFYRDGVREEQIFVNAETELE